MKTVYIAEKPDIARAIAGFLWPDGGYQKNKYNISNGDTVVCWCHGHILRTKQPHEYDPDYKSWSNYQIFPKKWEYVPSEGEKELLEAIDSQLKTADTVVHAGDPDREGQLLVEEVLRYCHYTGPVKRLLINAKDDVSMKRAFDHIEDNKKYEPLYQSALARQQADWLVGMNLTRAYTVNSRKFGYDTTFRIGRVQIPTLALVVRREREISKFKSKTYYELIGTFTKDNIPFKAKFVPGDDLPTDEENRILDKNIIKAVMEKVRPAAAVIESAEEKEGSKQPPLPHSLDTLQVLANKKLSMSPAETLEIVQALYEKKYVTYPRSDCNYIPASQKDDAKRILPMLQHYGLPAAITANPERTSKAFNDSKVTAHHAIIPTGVEPKDLSSNEMKLYQLIAEYYCYQFYEPYRFKKVTFTVKAADCLFKGSGTIPIVQGYMAIFDEKEKKEKPEDNAVLPSLKAGDSVAADYAAEKKQTTPPKRFTEGSLLAAMANIWRYVAPDNPNREKLKEVKGIGTPATRHTIIATLQSSNGHKVDPYMKKKGKSKELVPTEIGCSVIDSIDQNLTYPDTTAEMEYELANIAGGSSSRDSYLTSVITLINSNIRHAETASYPPPPGKKVFSCPICQAPLLRKYTSKFDMHFWICSNKDCVSPVTGQPIFYSEKNDEPVFAFCPKDKAPLSRWKGKFGYFWKCKKCNSTYSDHDGEPDFTPKKKSK